MLAACASTRPYARLAEAGSTYALSSSRLLTLAGRVRVDATSERLLQLDEADNVDLRSYRELSAGDIERLEIVGRLRAHAQLLAQYFSRLNQLASSKAPADAASSANSLAGSLNQIGTQLRGSSLLKGRSLPGMVAGALLQVKASGLLKRELQEHAQTIREEILTQELMLDALREDVERDLKLISAARERRTVIVPLTAAAKVADASEWVAARQAVLTGSNLPEELGAATAAARELRAAFEALAGTGSPGSVDALGLRMRELQSQVERIP